MHHLSIKEIFGRDWTGIPVTTGVPLTRGKLFPSDNIQLITGQGESLSCNIEPTALWPDNSIKWCMVRTVLDLPAHQQLDLKLTSTSGETINTVDIDAYLRLEKQFIEVRTRNCRFKLGRDAFNLFDQLDYRGKKLLRDSDLRLRTDAGTYATPKITEITAKPVLTHEDIQSVQVQIHGYFQSEPSGKIASFESTLDFFIATDTVRCTFTIHNTRSARHNAGLWDLGDPNTLLFENLDFNLALDNSHDGRIKTQQGSNWTSSANHQLSLYQSSSGGEHWDSPNHVNRDNRIPVSFDGYKLTDGKGIITNGKRASPFISIKTHGTALNFHPEKFWQNFPKSSSYTGDSLSYGLFPEDHTDLHELQPGEKKTHTFWINIDENPDSLSFTEQMPRSWINPEWMAKCHVFPYPQVSPQDPVLKIISRGLEGESNFFEKREAIDEYGWRNFGDLYADHETDGYTGKDLFISHYNNQYDPLYGFLQLFAMSGDERWFELANDLAIHITDIDIYDTSSDKAEYNYGLFWHTDHYLPAETSSHRSYSRHQKQDAYEGHVGGGGPGGQHCYTTGLLYHYLMTGSESSRRAIFQLSQWIYHFYEGSGTIFDIVVSIKNRNRIDLKNIFRNQYPFDRGTGNYIVSILDKHYLTQEESLLDEIGQIIRHTINPADDIDQRHLLDVELNWHYTVFLQALVRYLKVKEEHLAFDDDFYHAMHSLLHYARWMAANEAPYLDNPTNLEFPNYTWAAQDIRKANILYSAARFDPVKRDLYLEKADAFKNYVIETLNGTDTSAYTRILSILMQNMTPLEYDRPHQADYKQSSDKYITRPRAHNTLQSIINISRAFFKAAANFSLSREISWIRSRVSR